MMLRRTIGVGAIVVGSLFLGTGIASGTGGGPPPPNPNQVEFWCPTGGIKYEPVSTPFVVPAPPSGFVWTLLVLKAGNEQTSVEVENETFSNPVVGESYVRSDGKNISHAILCKAVTTTVPTTTPTTVATTLPPTTQFTVPTTLPCDEENGRECPTTTLATTTVPTTIATTTTAPTTTLGTTTTIATTTTGNVGICCLEGTTTVATTLPTTTVATTVPTTAPPTTAAPTTVATTAAPVAPAPTELPVTGSSSGWLLGSGLGSIVAGLIALATSKRGLRRA
jgi:hypothetical protein